MSIKKETEIEMDGKVYCTKCKKPQATWFEAWHKGRQMYLECTICGALHKGSKIKNE